MHTTHTLSCKCVLLYTEVQSLCVCACVCVCLNGELLPMFKDPVVSLQKLRLNGSLGLTNLADWGHLPAKARPVAENAEGWHEQNRSYAKV